MPYTRLFYHCIWSTKRRQPLIDDENRGTIYDCIIAKARTLHAFVHAINGTSDHIHVVATVPPSIALATFIGQIKGFSSYHASRLKGPGVIVPFEWQEEYGVLSISETHLPAVVRYVERQQIHHADGTIIHELETMPYGVGP